LFFYSKPKIALAAEYKLCRFNFSDWIRDFSPWANSAMEAAKETKFGTKVA